MRIFDEVLKMEDQLWVDVKANTDPVKSIKLTLYIVCHIFLFV